MTFAIVHHTGVYGLANMAVTFVVGMATAISFRANLGTVGIHTTSAIVVDALVDY